VDRLETKTGVIGILPELVKEFFQRKDLARASKKKILYDNPRKFYAL